MPDGTLDLEAIKAREQAARAVYEFVPTAAQQALDDIPALISYIDRLKDLFVDDQEIIAKSITQKRLDDAEIERLQVRDRQREERYGQLVAAAELALDWFVNHNLDRARQIEVRETLSKTLNRKEENADPP